MSDPQLNQPSTGHPPIVNLYFNNAVPQNQPVLSQPDVAKNVTSVDEKGNSKPTPVPADKMLAKAKEIGRDKSRIETNVKLPPLSEELLSKVSSRNVSEWKRPDVELWLEYVFEGTSNELLSRYLSYVKKIGMKGTDLLGLSDRIYDAMEITEPLHLSRIRQSFDQLVTYQTNFCKEKEDAENAIKAERLYVETKAEYEELERLNQGSLPLQLPQSIKSWKLVHVFAFFKRPAYEPLAKIFLKPLILSNIEGEQLLTLADPLTKVQPRLGTDKAGVFKENGITVMRLVGLEADESDIEKLKDTVMKYKKKKEESKIINKESAKTELWKSLGFYDKSKLIQQELIGQGSFGCVYRALYDKKKVVMKILQNSRVAGNNRGGMQIDSMPSKEDLLDDLVYEATMLLKAETSGVVKLIAVDKDRSPPCMIIEYLPNKTLEHEYNLAKRDPESIFHPENEHHNAINKVSNPVLLQMVRIARDVAGALARIHALGIVHLDIAARNILLDLKKRPKIADFGCAAMEADMIEMYELRGRYGEDDIDENAEKEKDEDFPRKNRMYLHERAVEWMPHWVAGNKKRPRIDQHTDVYSFGCLMYEIAAFLPPHHQHSKKDVAEFKKTKPFNPPLPPNLDKDFAAIILSCWDDYNKQPTMKMVANELSKLHSKLATESVSETIQRDTGYWEFHDVKPKPDAFRSHNTFTSTERKGSGYGGIPQQPRSSTAHSADRIQLNFTKVDVTEAPSRLVEYEMEGYDKARLESALHCAFCLRDHQSIVVTMLCIQIDDNKEQITMIVKCLEYLKILAEDQHGSTNEDDAFQWLCKSIFNIVKEAAELKISSSLQSLLIGSSLLALSSLLMNKTLTEDGLSGNDESFSFESELCSIVTDALEKFTSNETVIENVSIAVFSFCGLSQLIIRKLNAAGTVSGLLKALTTYEDNLKVALRIVQAIGCFPIQCLIECVQVENKRAKKGTPSRNNTNSPLASPDRDEGAAPVNENAVYHSLFGIIHKCVHNLSINGIKEDSGESLVITLLETCLSSMFRMCESGINDKNTINRLLYPVTGEDIETLYEAIKLLPNDFSVQEGAIGLLAHIVSTGFSNTRDIKKKTTIILPSEQRISKLLELDPSLSLFLKAMEKFKISNRNATGIVPTAGEPVGVYGNTSDYSQTKKSGYGVTVAKMRSITSSSWSDGDTFLEQQEFEMDETGEPITAAALQRSVSIILGIACSSRKLGKRVQENLLGTRYNENILFAFKTFSKDVGLIRFGCQALFCTARRHAKHQEMLNKLFVFDYLKDALHLHRLIWEVVEAVICAIMGLLEPPLEVSKLPNSVIQSIKFDMNIELDKGPSTAEENKKYQELLTIALKDRKKQFVGYNTAWKLILPEKFSDEVSHSLLQLLAIFVASFEVREECQNLVMSFLKLVCCIGFWLPEEAKMWNEAKVFVDLRILKFNFLESFILRLLVENIQKHVQGGTSSLKGEDINKGIDAIHAYARELTLIEYTLRAINIHKTSLGVVASGLSLMTSIIRGSLTGDDLIVGNEISAYRDKSSAIYKHRVDAESKGLIFFCKLAASRQEDNPVLIRYSLWLLIIFLSQSGNYGEDGEENPAKRIAAQLSVAGLVEWAIAVANNYIEFYSLQSLAMHFLVWMELHGMFDSKPPDRLEEIMDLATRNRDDSIPFKKIEEEGHDTYLVGGEAVDFFGDLSTVAQKLYRFADSHLPSNYRRVDKTTRKQYAPLKAGSESKGDGKSKDSKDDDNELLEVMAKELSVSVKFLSSVPRNVREWNARNALDWFREMFSDGSQEGEEHLRKFQRDAITGDQLLITEESTLMAQIGINLPTHKKTFSDRYKKLLSYQEKHTTEYLYYKLEGEYKERISKGAYELPLSMSTWQPLDVFAFLKLPENASLHKFLKPIAMSQLQGEQLLFILKPETEVKRKEPNTTGKSETFDGSAKLVYPADANIIYLLGLEPDADVGKLKAAIRDCKNSLDKRIQQQKQDALTELWKKLGSFDRTKLTILELLGQGSFGSVYRAQYEKKKVVVKQLFANNTNRKKEDVSEELKYEAMMLLKAETIGVVKLIAIAADYDPPRMVIEYLPNKTLEHEYLLAVSNDVNSMFHEENEYNLIEKTNNRVINPVLLQMVRIARDVAGTLARIHEKGIVHLDIAARNILLDLKKRPKIADFGCAVMETDMIEMYTLIKNSPELNIKARCENDEDFAKKYHMYIRTRPVKWMPHWAVDDERAPKIDRKTDVYAFGCLMYELAMKKIPHVEESDEEILKQKKEQRINPDIPRNIDSRYCSIMSSCWEYYERQPSMATIAKQLSALHTEIATQNAPKDPLYSELSQTLFPKRDTRSITSAVPSSHMFNTLYDSDEGIQKRNRIYLNFEKVIVNATHSKLLQLREGFEKEKLLRALHCAHRFRDHQTIALLMKCVPLSDNEEIIEIICLCLEYLGSLAEDQHGSTNEEDTYQWLCYAIIDVVKETKRLEKDLAFENGAKIIAQSLSSLASLLKHKSIPENSNSTEHNFETDLCNIVFNALQIYGKDETVAEKVAAAIFSFSGLSQVMASQLHQGGAIGGLLVILKDHQTSPGVVLEIVRALSCFPIQYLLEPVFITELQGTDPSLAEPIYEKPVKAQVSSTFGGKKAALLEKRKNKNVPNNNQGITTNPVVRIVHKSSEDWGKVYNQIFVFVVQSVQELEDSRRNGEPDDELTVFILETCLTSLFRICESGVNDSTLINQFLHSVMDDALITLVSALRLFPERFVIQENAIGLLAHVVTAGNPITIQSIHPPQVIQAAVPSEERLRILLEKDPQLKLIVSAMELFKVNEEISIGIKDIDPNYIADTTFHSRTKSATTATSRTKASMTSFAEFSKLNLGASPTAADDADELTFNIDENGEQITAAALQRSAAVILGIACYSPKYGRAMQDRLENSIYNETILLSFQNFRRDVSLIRFGCHALYYTCRKHAKHQKMLKDLFIFKHLYQALERHKTIWEVVGAVIRAITGMLEPPTEVTAVTPDIIDSAHKAMGFTSSITSADKAKMADLIKQAIQKRKESFLGFSLAKKLAESKTNSQLQQLAILVAEFQINEECDVLVQNFLLLIGCIHFWMPQILKLWIQDTFVNIDPLLQRSRFKQHYDIILSSPNNAILLKEFGSSKNNKSSGKKEDLNLVQFTLFCLCKHSHQPHVLAAGLAIVTATIRQVIPEDVPIGENIPDYSNTKSAIYHYRQTAMNTDLLKLCMEAAAKKLDHPILIRYSLWLLLIFISELKSNNNNTTSNNEEDSDAKIIASISGIGGSLQWAIVVAKKYTNYYSLQLLASYFIYWMEYHGRFENKDADRLEEMKRICELNLSNLQKDKNRDEATESPIFRPMEQEGIDTYLLGVTNEKFGNLEIISQKLLGKVNAYLKGTVNNASSTLSSALSSSSSSKAEVSTVIWINEDEHTKRGVEFMRPFKIVVSGHQSIKDETGKNVALHEIVVYWSGVKRWTILRRFNDCLSLKDDLEFEFRHIDISVPSNENIKKSVSSVFAKALGFNKFMTQRGTLLEQWLNELKEIRPIIHGSKYLEFVKATINTDDAHYVRKLSPLITDSSLLEVHSVYFCNIHNLLIVGTGVPTSNLATTSSGTTNTGCKGKVKIYSFSTSSSTSTSTSSSSAPAWSDTDKRFHFHCWQEFTVSIDRVGYEPLRRMVVVALSTGAVVMFFLSTTLDEISYRTELNCHYHPICGLIINTTVPGRHLCLSASRAGTIASLNLITGTIHSQVSCEMGVKINCIDYNPYDQMVFCGSDHGVKLYDFAKRSATELVSLQGGTDGTNILALSFDTKRRLLYSVTGNTVSVWRIFSKTNKTRNFQFLTFFSINPSFTITSTLLLNDNQYLLVGENGGGIAVFDLFQSNSAGKGFQKKEDWHDPVLKGTGAMLAWLGKQRIDTSLAATRDDVIRLVATTANVSEDDVIEILLPDGFQDKPLLAWSTTDPVPLNNNAIPEKSFYCCTLLSQQQFIICGGKNGKITITSLADFIVPAKKGPTNSNAPLGISIVSEDGRQVALREGCIINVKK